MKILLTIITIVILLSFGVILIAKAQKYIIKGDTVKLNKETTDKLFVKKEVFDTGHTFIDEKKRKYNIYMSSTGNAFYYKRSAKTNKDYKVYLGKDISDKIKVKISFNPTNKQQ